MGWSRDDAEALPSSIIDIRSTHRPMLSSTLRFCSNNAETRSCSLAASSSFASCFCNVWCNSRARRSCNHSKIPIASSRTLASDEENAEASRTEPAPRCRRGIWATWGVCPLSHARMGSAKGEWRISLLATMKA